MSLNRKYLKFTIIYIPRAVSRGTVIGHSIGVHIYRVRANKLALTYYSEYFRVGDLDYWVGRSPGSPFPASIPYINISSFRVKSHYDCLSYLIFFGQLEGMISPYCPLVIARAYRNGSYYNDAEVIK